MSEANNGQNSALTPAQRKPKRHTGKFIDGRKRQAIITALANGESLRSIARSQRVSFHTVYAIREQNWQQVAARKERLAAQAERNATLSAELITAQLESGKPIPLSTLNMTFGVNVDKSLALRANPTIQVDHTHQHIHAHINEATYQQILDNLP